MKVQDEFQNPREMLLTCAPGLEELLLDEMVKLGIHRGKVVTTSCVSIQLSIDSLMHLLENTRLASRVLLPLREFAAHDSRMLYDQVRRIRWPEVFDLSHTFRVECHGQFPAEIKASFAPLKIKDAICDEFRKLMNDARPSVAEVDPDILIQAYFERGRCTLSVDLCGIPLHRRGYRLNPNEAPLREDRAAALLEFCGYRGNETLVDPFCGSGTIPIEAAISLKNLPFRPGTFLSHLALFKVFPDLQRSGARTQAELKPQSFKPIFASDIDPAAIRSAKENAERAGVSHWIQFESKDALQLTLADPENTLIVANPPYGERLKDKEGASELIKNFANHLKRNLAPVRLGMIVSEDLKSVIGLRPQRQVTMKSGDLKLKMLYFEIRKGRFK